jgi:hypothetical protein
VVHLEDGSFKTTSPRGNEFPSKERLHKPKKIPTRIGPDILRWGHSTTRKFSVKEAYYL